MIIDVIHVSGRDTFKLLSYLYNILIRIFSIVSTSIINVFDLIMVLRTRYVVTPLTDFPTQYFGPKESTYLLSEIPTSNKISKTMYCSPFLIYLCLLTLRIPQYFMSTGVKFSAQKFSRVEKP